MKNLNNVNLKFVLLLLFVILATLVLIGIFYDKLFQYKTTIKYFSSADKSVVVCEENYTNGKLTTAECNKKYKNSYDSIPKMYIPIWTNLTNQS